MTLTSAQAALKGAITRTHEHRSVLVARTRDEDRHRCAACSGPLEADRVTVYQLCDRCLGGLPERRVTHGVDAALEAEAAAWMADHGAALEAPIGGPEMSSRFHAVQSTTSAPEDGPREVYARPGAPGLLELVDTNRNTVLSRRWGQAPHEMHDSRHRLSELHRDFRTAYCSAHGHRVRVVLDKTVGDRTYWRCAENDTYRHQARRNSGTKTVDD